MGSSSGGSTKTTTVQKLSPESRQLLDLIMPTIKGYVNPDGSVNASTYPGSTVAPVNANQTLGQEMVLGQSGAAQASANAANSGLNFLSSGQVLDPKSNPYLSDAINAAIRPITQNYTETVLGNIRDNAQLAGAFGYNRQGLEEAAAGRDYMRQVGDTSATMASANYQAGLDAMGRSLAFAPSVQGMLYTPGTAVAGVGQQQQNLAQQQLDAAVQKFYQQQYLPLSLAEEIAGIAYGNPSGSVTSTGQGAGTSGLQSALGLGAAGASLGSMIMPGVGTAAGGALGALLGLFG